MSLRLSTLEILSSKPKIISYSTPRRVIIGLVLTLSLTLVYIRSKATSLSLKPYSYYSLLSIYLVISIGNLNLSSIY